MKPLPFPVFIPTLSTLALFSISCAGVLEIGDSNPKKQPPLVSVLPSPATLAPGQTYVRQETCDAFVQFNSDVSEETKKRSSRTPSGPEIAAMVIR